jgi:hypothetical protein
MRQRTPPGTVWLVSACVIFVGLAALLITAAAVDMPGDVRNSDKESSRTVGVLGLTADALMLLLAYLLLSPVMIRIRKIRRRTRS